MSEQHDRVTAFHALHGSGCFVMPNPWDVGSARALEQLGFPALATTSAGMAWTLGRPDTEATLEEALAHLRAVAAAVRVPVNADFQDGYAVDPELVGANVGWPPRPGSPGSRSRTPRATRPTRCSTSTCPSRGSAPRGRRSTTAAPASLLTGRSEGFVVGRPDLDETIRRLQAYAEAGADCLYAPRIGTVEQVAAIVAAVSPKPVNLLVNAPFITVAEAADLGVRRISVGGTLARTAWGGFLAAAHEIADAGTFTAFQDLPDVDGLLGR